MKRFFLQPIDDLANLLERQIITAGRPWRAAGLVLIAATVSWFCYVPIHELLHVAGCVLTGGQVSELQLSPIYGAGVLQKVFPFIVSGGDYAGRLSGFDTRGSDFIYLATDFAPFLLTVFVGVPLLQRCGRRGHALLAGPALILGLAPLINLIGDYFEMGSVMVTRVATLLGRGGHDGPDYAAVRSDDIFRLIEQMTGNGDEPFNLTGGETMTVAVTLAVLSAVTAILLAWTTYAAGAAFGRRLGMAPGKPAADNATEE
ncbi:MAG: hypothetical protein ACE5GE_03725 [Phycisphaerae bacterium]